MTNEKALEILDEGLQSVTSKLNGLRLLSVLFPDLNKEAEAAQQVHDAMQLACAALREKVQTAAPAVDVGTMVEEAACDRAQFIQDVNYADTLIELRAFFHKNTPRFTFEEVAAHTHGIAAYNRAISLLRRVPQ